MHLVVQVVFNYQIGTHALNNKYGKYTTKRELIRAIEQTENPYELVITRTVQIVDTDSKHENSGMELFFPEKQKAIEIDSENIKFVLADKLMYPRDVRQILMQKYNSVLDFDDQKWNEDIPVLYSGVMEDSKTGLMDSITGAPTHYTLHYVNCRPLTLDDIVINKKMNQIWPKATNALPAPLLVFLSRKKERVYTK